MRSLFDLFEEIELYQYKKIRENERNKEE